MGKYSNSKTVVDNIKFDSKAEATRYCQLKILVRAGKISDLKLQVPFVLARGVRFAGKRATPDLRYLADFVYFEGGALVVEDCKGCRTEGYRIKRHLMLAVHGIEVQEVK